MIDENHKLKTCNAKCNAFIFNLETVYTLSTIWNGSIILILTCNFVSIIYKMKISWIILRKIINWTKNDKKCFITLESHKNLPSLVMFKLHQVAGTKIYFKLGSKFIANRWLRSWTKFRFYIKQIQFNRLFS